MIPPAIRSTVAAAALLVIIGCGYDTYEQRLSESVKYFQYVDKLNQNLARAYTGNAVKQLRVPIQFRQIPAPPPQPLDDQGNAVGAPEADRRQPDYIRIEFPGLEAAWEADFQVTVDNMASSRKGYIYLTSNFAMFATPEAPQASQFIQMVLDATTDGLRVPPERADGPHTAGRPFPNGRPQNELYFPLNTYDIFNLKPESLIDNAQYTFDVYVIKNQDLSELKLAVVVVLPVGIDSRANIADRVNLMLETAQVFEARATAGSGKGPRPGAGASPSGGF